MGWMARCCSAQQGSRLSGRFGSYTQVPDLAAPVVASLESCDIGCRHCYGSGKVCRVQIFSPTVGIAVALVTFSVTYLCDASVIRIVLGIKAH
jgi:hypothetical protein